MWRSASKSTVQFGLPRESNAWLGKSIIISVSAAASYCNSALIREGYGRLGTGQKR